VEGVHGIPDAEEGEQELVECNVTQRRFVLYSGQNSTKRTGKPVKPVRGCGLWVILVCKLG
jgi:hypothetical protein